ncbi:MAG: DUF362 domain-containing protein, partial [Acidobacteria bacterium]|nr:DUF362 domain-containing protein [Acidobacteriota bacterium]
MAAKVFFLRTTDKEDDSAVAKRLKQAVRRLDLFSFIGARDMVAVKTHFGERNSNGYVRPLYLKTLGEQIKHRQAIPFLTETSTLYRGQRSNAVDHLRLAHEHGFTLEKTGMPIIMADGLRGDEEIEVVIPGQLYRSVKIASLIARAHALVVIS